MMTKRIMTVLMAVAMIMVLASMASAKEKIFTGTITAPISQSNLKVDIKGNDPGALYYLVIDTGIKSDWVKDFRLIKDDIPRTSVVDQSTEVGWKSLESGYRKLQFKDGEVRILLATDDDGTYWFNLLGDYKLIIKYIKPRRIR